MPQVQDGTVANYIKIIFYQYKTQQDIYSLSWENGDEKLCGRKKTHRKSVLQMQISQVVMFSLCLGISNESKFVQNLKISVFICVCLLSLYYSLWFYQFPMIVYFIFPQQVIFVSGMGCFTSAKLILSLCVSLSKQASPFPFLSLQGWLTGVVNVDFAFFQLRLNSN